MSEIDWGEIISSLVAGSLTAGGIIILILGLFGLALLWQALVGLVFWYVWNLLIAGRFFNLPMLEWWQAILVFFVLVQLKPGSATASAKAKK